MNTEQVAALWITSLVACLAWHLIDHVTYDHDRRKWWHTAVPAFLWTPTVAVCAKVFFLLLVWVTHG